MNKKIFVFTALAIASVACDDVLNVTDPENTSVTTALSNDNNVKLVLTGTYDALSGSDLFGGDVLRNSELLAANDEIQFNGTYGDALEIYTKEIITSNANVKDFWIGGYKAINMANNVLRALAVVKEEDREWVEGEALFLRGLTYFEMVKFFAKPYSAGNTDQHDALPIVLTPSNGLDERVVAPRNSVAEVYERVILDLERAAKLLKDHEGDGTRATREAALAILSRVYLQTGDYSKARDAANEVIVSDNFALATDVWSLYQGGTTEEDIFNIPVSTTDGINRMQLFYASPANGGRGDIRIMQKHLDIYEAGDERAALFYEDTSNGHLRTSKWINQFGNVKVIRLAELYLTRAEANFRLGTSIGNSPLNDVNTIRERAGLDPLASLTLDEILHERRVELAHEGQRLHDVKRLQQSISNGSDILTFDANVLVFPVPQSERNLNPNLSQNQGYF